MRLLKLKITNIASLKGEHIIDFTTIQEASSLFAITGETGAGKSSVLNSLGLALYGQVYKKNVNQVDVVTLGEKEGSIELIFQVGPKNYLADWKAKVRKQNGELLKQPSIQRTIQALNGVDFKSLREDVVESIEELLNMDFDQFTKCIILNQGEFARFLMSSFTERKEILEKLYPGELLDNLGRELKGEMDEIKRQLTEIQTQLETHKSEGLSGEDLASEKERLKNELTTHEAWSVKIETVHSHFATLMHYHEKFHTNNRKIETVKNDIGGATTLYNYALKESQELTVKLNKEKSEAEIKLPHLQALLKMEEALKLNLQTQSSYKQKAAQLNLQINEHMKLNDELTKKMLDWDKTHQEHLKSFKYPVKELKELQKEINQLVDLVQTETELKKELIGHQDKLNLLESQGKEAASELAQIKAKIEPIPNDLQDRLKNASVEKEKIQQSIQERQRLEVLVQESARQQKELEAELEIITTKREDLKKKLALYQQELNTLEISLELHEYKNAIDYCLTHAHEKSLKDCPVCEQSVLPASWERLVKRIEQSDAEAINLRSSELSKFIMSAEEELKILKDFEKSIRETLVQKKQVYDSRINELSTPMKSITELEKAIEALKKQDWELAVLKADELKKEKELGKIRENFSHVRAEVQKRGLTLTTKQNELGQLTPALHSLIDFPVSEENLNSLKEDCRLLSKLIQSEALGDKLQQESIYLGKSISRIQMELKNITQEETTLMEKISSQQEKLKSELKDESADELILILNRRIKELNEEWQRGEKVLKQHEVLLKELQGKLYPLNDLLKDIDIQFRRALHDIKENSQGNIGPLHSEVSILVKRLSEFSLDFTDPEELFIPINEELLRHKEEIKEATNLIRMNFSAISTRLSDWEKLQDKILLLEMKRQEFVIKNQRQERLNEVLGKDELRSFVLSLVEENLIIQTNDELQKLCQGRYEIIHQSRGSRPTPDFYILDKFREGGLRKVSTLSGGETFMVSLAMALALAEMTRGQAEIDSLFIDEGFGTLDQESMEDVLDMLHQIQTRGLLVGIISHIKSLTDAVPINLVLKKKQDGTSSMSLQYN